MGVLFLLLLLLFVFFQLYDKKNSNWFLVDSGHHRGDT